MSNRKPIAAPELYQLDPGRNERCLIDSEPAWNAPASRRDLLRWTSYGLASLSVMAIDGCSWTKDERKFFFRGAFTWEREQVFEALAFSLFGSSTEPLLDYLDLQCSGCALTFRLFLLGVSVASDFMITCPECQVALRVSIVASRLLVEELVAHSMSRAVAFLASDGYWVHKVASFEDGDRAIKVGRSAVCYAVTGHEPDGVFQREIPAVPDQICYFTEMECTSNYRRICHIWRRDGRPTDDPITLDIRTNKWRTFSTKRHLAPGVWVVTTEAENGAVLDVREFQIARA